MVGVPGRSKGCSTCRLRRKGCDKQRPSCGQCSRLGVRCGGYERETIFVHQEAVGESSTLQVTPYRKPLALVNVPTSGDLIRSAHIQLYITAFLDRYIPKGNRTPSDSYDFVGYAYQLSPSDKAVELSLLSLGLCAEGKLAPGLEAYGRALSKLQTQLRLQTQTDSVLIASKLLDLFEIFYGESSLNLLSQCLAWHGHLQGQAAVILAHRPEAYKSGPSHQLFVDARGPLLVEALKDRKRFALNSREWRTIPWEQEPKTYLDKLHDIAADISEVLVDVDEARRCEDELYRTARLGDLMSACRGIDQSLRQWSEEAPLKNFFDESGTLLEPSGIDDLALSYMTVLYWTICIILYANIYSLLDPCPPEYPADIDPRSYMAKAANAFPYFWKPGAGVSGAYLAAFPLGFCLHIALSDLNFFAKEYAYLNNLVWSSEVGKSVLGFLTSLHRTSGDSKYIDVDGGVGLELRAKSWLYGHQRGPYETLQ